MTKKKQVFITKRDKELFSYLFKNKVATTKQIKRDIFSDISIQTVNRRLFKLRNKNLISSSSILDAGKFSSVHGITKNCFKQWILRNGEEGKGAQLKSYCPDHDLALNEIRYSLSKSTTVEGYYTENQLVSDLDLNQDQKISSFVSLRVDAVLKMRAIDNKLYILGVEYESSFKNKARCISKVRNYYLYPETSTILFICSNQRMLKIFSKIEKEIIKSKSPRLFFCLLKNLTEGNESITFSNTKGKKLAFR